MHGVTRWCSLAALLQHGFEVDGEDESSSEVSDSDSSDSDVPVGVLAAKTKRKAAAAAEKKLEATDGNETQVFSDSSESQGSGDDWTPRRIEEGVVSRLRG